MFSLSMSGRLLLLIVLIVAIPMIASGFLVSLQMQQAMTEEKSSKLFGAARILDSALTESYDDILQRHGALTADRATKIRILNEELRDRTDLVAKAYPGMGVGYYSKELDAILTYGPAAELGNTVGLSIAQNHKGRVVMETGEELIQEGGLVRGDIMNAMRPVIRNNTIIGYIWANELVSSIELQMGVIRRNIFLAIVIGLLVGLLGVTEVIGKFTDNIQAVRHGILKLQDDFDYRLPMLKDELGQIVAAINQMADELAAKRQSENQVQHAEHMAVVGEIAAGMAHEIRNPLMSIRGFAQLLQEDAAKDSHQHEYLDIIVRETQRMNHLIEQLLRYARPPEGHEDSVPVNMILEDTLQLTEIRLRKNNICLEKNLATNLPDLQVDRGQLKQVFLNLLINAIQAIQEHADRGVIRVESFYDTEAAQIRIRFTDTGGGIPEEIQDRIFLPFFTTKEQGTGLGLAVVRRTVDSLNGRIEAASELGKGTTFTLLLPVAREES